MSQKLVDYYDTTASSVTTTEQLEVEIANDFARKINSYSDYLLMRNALRKSQAQFHQSLFHSYLPATAHAVDWGSMTALNFSVIQDSFRRALRAAIENYASLIFSAEHEYDYLYEDESPSEVIPSKLSKVRVSTKGDVELPWA